MEKKIIYTLLLIGIFFIFSSSQLNEYINGDVKDIHLYYNLHHSVNQTDNDILNIDFFNWIYDFTNNNGKISFKASCNDNAEIPFKNGRQEIIFGNIEFEFFESIKITDIYAITNISTGKPEYRIDFDYNLNGFNTIEFSKYYVLNKFNSQKRNNYSFEPMNKIFTGETIVVEFESNFEPDGTFIIQTKDYNKIKGGLGKHSDGNVNFILGNDYILTELTTSNTIEEVYKSSDTSISLGITQFYNDNLNEDIIFGLNSINKKILIWKTIFLGLGISLLSSGIILLIENFKISKF